MKIIIKIIIKILNFLFEIVSRKIKSEENISEVETPEEVLDNRFFSKEKWDESRKFLEENKLAYLEGHILWGKGGLVGVHNNVLYAKDNKDKIIVKRTFNRVYFYRGHQKISKKVYKKGINDKKSAYQTYCNIFVGIFTQQFCGFIISYIDRSNIFNANQCYDNLKSGFYNDITEIGIIKEVKLQEALEHARKNGLSIASMRKKKGSGHIAVLTGKGSKMLPGSVEVYQAGKKFGLMKFKTGFGYMAYMKTKYYIWIDK